jgi:hypothetical protein
MSRKGMDSVPLPGQKAVPNWWRSYNARSPVAAAAARP